MAGPSFSSTPLPGVDISFQNGNLGQFAQSKDGVFGLVAHAKEIGEIPEQFPKWRFTITDADTGLMYLTPIGGPQLPIGDSTGIESSPADLLSMIESFFPVTDYSGNEYSLEITNASSYEFEITANSSAADLDEDSIYFVLLNTELVSFAPYVPQEELTLVNREVYVLTGQSSIDALGLIDDIDNHILYKWLQEFYAEAGEGAELWLNTISKSSSLAGNLGASAGKLMTDSNFKINGIFTLMNPESYTIDVVDGLDASVFPLVHSCQTICQSFIDLYKAPIFIIIEGYGFDGDGAGLLTLAESEDNHVGVAIGDTETRTGVTASQGAATGLIAGRLSKNQVHVNMGKVRDGALNCGQIYIVDTPIEACPIGFLYEKHYLTFRTHIGRTGYFILDDNLATLPTDDYKHLTHRRVINKAFRVAYAALLDSVLDDIPVTNTGTILPSYAKTLEGKVTSAIFAQMTALGELSVDDTDKNDRGVICKIDLTNNILQNSTIKLEYLSVRPKGHARFIRVPLGFINVSNT